MKLNRLKTTIALGLTGGVAVFAVLIAPLTGSVGPAAAAGPYTCMEFVSWKAGSQSGINPIEPPMTGTFATVSGGEPVSGATITDAATACHLKTHTAFMNDTAWSDPTKVCASQGGHPDSYGRIFNDQTRTVWVLDRFKEIAETPQRYNRVDAYTVTCGPTVVWDHTLAGGVAPAP